MATGVFDTYDTIGIREDLADRIWDVSPTDTPLVSSIPKTRATQTNHEFQTDKLRAPEHRPSVEGADNRGDNSSPTVRIGNYTQIIEDTAIVSGTNEQVDAAGRDSEMAYQIARIMEETKTNIEASAASAGRTIGTNESKDAGTDTTARVMGAAQVYIGSNYSAGAAGGAPAPTPPFADGAGERTAGTNRTVTEPLLQDLLTDMYNNGSKASAAIMPADIKGTVSNTFNGGTTRYNTADDKKLVASVDVYAGDFHTLELMPSRIIQATDMVVFDPEYMALAELRPMFDKALGDTGDSWKRQVIWEGTLVVRNEQAHGVLADITAT